MKTNLVYLSRINPWNQHGPECHICPDSGSPERQASQVDHAAGRQACHHEGHTDLRRST